MIGPGGVSMGRSKQERGMDAWPVYGLSRLTAMDTGWSTYFSTFLLMNLLNVDFIWKTAQNKRCNNHLSKMYNPHEYDPAPSTPETPLVPLSSHYPLLPPRK